MGFCYYFSRHHEQAIEELGKVIEMYPNYFPAYLVMAGAYEQENRFDEAITACERARQINNFPLVAAELGHAYARAGQTQEALAILAELHEETQHSYVSAYELATVYIGLDEQEQAFTWLEGACGERAGWLVFLRSMPRYDRLRADPRFQDLLRRVGLIT